MQNDNHYYNLYLAKCKAKDVPPLTKREWILNGRPSRVIFNK